MNKQTKDFDARASRASWPSGPWDTEPDRIEFRHAGLPCLMVRNRMGAWCGYAAVSPGHPDFERHYDDVDVDAHGGLTYADHCQGDICHVPAQGETDNVWWFGFDCGHGGDIIPGYPGFSTFGVRSSYRDVAYVRNEVVQLAEQLAKRAVVT